MDLPQGHSREPDAPKVEKRLPVAENIEKGRQRGHAVQNSVLGKTMGALRQAREGATALGQKAWNNATPTNLGLAAAGAGLGGGALYGISRLLQSEEDRKKKTPVLAPALGAVGGAALLPIIAALLSRGGAKPLNMDGFNTSNGPANYADAVAHASGPAQIGTPTTSTYPK
jgi:hypothetical protein